MPKSRGRTVDTPVMGVEGWPQVGLKNSVLSIFSKDYGYDKKGHFPKKGVMPYAKGKTSKNAVC